MQDWQSKHVFDLDVIVGVDHDDALILDTMTRLRVDLFGSLRDKAGMIGSQRSQLRFSALFTLNSDLPMAKLTRVF